MKMNTMFPKLFGRGKISRVEVKDRIVKSPTRVATRNLDGSVTDRMIRYYEEVARSGSNKNLMSATVYRTAGIKDALSPQS